MRNDFITAYFAKTKGESMKTKLCLTAIVVLMCVLLVYQPAHSGVSSDELGRMLLRSNYEGPPTLGYNVYYEKGPLASGKKGGWHPGIDYRARKPLDVYSPVNGVIDSFDKEGSGFGRVSVKIDGTNDYFIFLHLSKVKVSKGQKVKTGETIIGKTGDIGAKGSPHLHVEARRGKSLAAYYFESKNNTGVNKDPASVVNR